MSKLSTISTRKSANIQGDLGMKFRLSRARLKM